MTAINKDAFEQYRKVFGTEKMRLLWQEFYESTENKLQQIEKQSPEDIRLCFHTLRSSSLVFGLEEFSKTCEMIEEAVLNNENFAKIKKYVDKTRRIFYNGCESINNLFKDL